MVGQARQRRNSAPPRAGVQTIALTERTTSRLLERYCAALGGKAVAEAAIASANALHARFNEEIATVADVPEGAQAHVDFAARVLTITPAGASAAPRQPPADAEVEVARLASACQNGQAHPPAVRGAVGRVPDGQPRSAVPARDEPRLVADQVE